MEVSENLHPLFALTDSGKDVWADGHADETFAGFDWIGNHPASVALRTDKPIFRS